MNGIAKLMGKKDSEESPKPSPSALPGLEKSIKDKTDKDKRTLIQDSFNKSLGK